MMPDTNAPGEVDALGSTERAPAYSWYAFGILTLVYVLNFLDRTLM